MSGNTMTALYFLLLSCLCIHGYVQGQRPVDFYIAQLTAVSHLGNDGSLGGRQYRWQQLLATRDYCQFGPFDTKRICHLCQITHKYGLLLEIWHRNYSNIRNNQ